jgi:exopolysaccharide biosynthesis polyprenyl glycosylphosphotransferase
MERGNLKNNRIRDGKVSNQALKIISLRDTVPGVQKKKNALIIGWNRDSINLYDKIKDFPALGYSVKGFISVTDKKSKLFYREIPLLGNLSDLTEWVQYYSIDEVLIALDSDSYGYLNTSIYLCQKNNLNYRIVSDVQETVYGHVIQDIYKDIFKPREINIRRIFDYTVALFLILLFVPIFLLIALAIKLDSNGSVFYSQIRVGKDGREFRIYKFRSMAQDAEKKSGPIWAQKNDSRITRVGSLMRKMRIDELPQLINILKGDMSFIGPRPERPFFVGTFKQQIPLYTNRLKVKPGVTGWAQVKWGYDDTIEDVKEKLKYDLYYINGRSFLLDVKILFLTIGTVLLSKGQ